jgi:hypothetical protein
MFGSQCQTHRPSQTPHSYNCNIAPKDSDTLFSFITSLEITALHRSVMKDGILCELYVDTYSYVSDDRKI